MSAPNMNQPAIGFGPLAESELDASIEPWHLPHYIRQLELERRQRDSAAQPTDAAHPATDVSDDDEPRAGEGAGLVLWPLAVILAVAAASFLAWALKR